MSCRSLRSNVVYLAFVVFGLASWIMANGLFVEVAALYRRVPEGKALSAYMMVVMQASNIVPILYMMFNENQQRISMNAIIWILLFSGTIVCVLIAYTWMYTSVLFGHEHSTVSSTTSVVFYPFVSQFPTIYTSALSTGEGCGGVIAGVLGLLQDSGGEHLRFSIKTYFLAAGVVFIASSIAFLFLTSHSWAIAEKMAKYDEDIFSEGLPLLSEKSKEMGLVADSFQQSSYATMEKPSSFTFSNMDKSNLLRRVWKPLAVQWWICFFSYGVVPSVLPYLCTSYHNGAQVLMFSSILSMCADPLGRFLTSFWRWYHISYLNLLVTIVAFVLVYESILTSHRFFESYSYGGIFAVFSNCLFVFCFSFTQTMVYLTLKNEVHGNKEHARIAYQWAGFLTQLGGLSGTFIIFPIVTFFN